MANIQCHKAARLANFKYLLIKTEAWKSDDLLKMPELHVEITVFIHTEPVSLLEENEHLSPY